MRPETQPVSERARASSPGVARSANLRALPSPDVPDVYWSESQQCFIGHYHEGGKRKNQKVPVSAPTKPHLQVLAGFPGAGLPKHQELAQRWFNAFCESRLNGGPRTAPEVHVVHTIRTLLPRWFAEQKKLQRPHERKRVSQTWWQQWVLSQPIADVDLREMKVQDCIDWVTWVVEQGRSSSTNHHVLQAVKALVKEAIELEWVSIPENLFKRERVRRVVGKIKKQAGNVYVALTKEQAATLLTCEAVPAERRVLYALAIATGMRSSEVFGLRFSDVDLDAGTIRVFQQLTEDGKAHKDPRRDSHRVVPVHDQLRKALAWWRDLGFRRHTGTSPTGDSPVFPNRQGGFSRGTKPALFVRLDLATAGLPTTYEGKDNFDFQALRRTFATLLEEQDVSREQIAYLLGHGAKSVADRHYIGKRVERYMPLVNKLPLPEVAWPVW